MIAPLHEPSDVRPRNPCSVFRAIRGTHACEIVAKEPGGGLRYSVQGQERLRLGGR